MFVFTIDCEKIAVNDGKTLRLNVLALNELVLNSCARSNEHHVALKSGFYSATRFTNCDVSICVVEIMLIQVKARLNGNVPHYKANTFYSQE